MISKTEEDNTMKKLTTKESTKAKKQYKKDLDSCKSINELQWVYTDFAADQTLTCDDLFELIRDCKEKKAVFAAKGDRYTRAMKPECRK